MKVSEEQLKKIIFESLSTYNRLMKQEPFPSVVSELKVEFIINSNEYLTKLRDEK